MDDLHVLKDMCKDLSLLYVEDEQKIRHQATIYFSKFFGLVDEAQNGLEGLDKYKKSHYDIVITDISMPKLNGLDMSEKIKEIDKKQKIMIVSAYSNSQNILKAIEMGIDGYILKPFDYAQINEAIYKIAKSIKESRQNRLYEEKLEQLVYIRTLKARELEKEKIRNYKDALLTMVDLTEKRDTYTGGHSLRVAKYCKLIGKELNLNQEELDDLYEAAILHDIGKIAIPDSILLKPGKLNKIEYSIIQLHVKLGYEVLAKYPLFKKIADIIKVHHERIDGSGYPEGLKGDEISIFGKIMGVADAFDAMTTSRIYQARKTAEESLKELELLGGVKFDKHVVQASLRALKDIKIEQNITQEPFDEMEKERFSYFYKDQLTQIYNRSYLDLILNKNKFTNLYQKLQIILSKNFQRYNKQYGWTKGDDFLIKVAVALKENYPDSLVFRIHGDDFVILEKKEFILKGIDKIFKENSLLYQYLEIDLQKNSINSIESLEKYLK